MSQHGEAAEQVVNMATNAAVKTAECAAEIVGNGTLSLATFLLAVLKDQKKTKGRTRIQSFNGRPTKVFAIMAKDMKTFSKEAKEYGILYAAVMNRKSTDGIVDVVVSANDAARVNRIAERFALSTIEIQKTVNTPAEERAADTQNPTGRTTGIRPQLHPAAKSIPKRRILIRSMFAIP